MMAAIITNYSSIQRHNSYVFSDKCVHQHVFGGERLSSQDALLKTESALFASPIPLPAKAFGSTF